MFIYISLDDLVSAKHPLRKPRSVVNALLSTMTPHVAAKAKHSAIEGRTKQREDYKTSLKVRKRIEEAFGWMKTVGGLAKTKLIGQAKLAEQALRCFAAYNLVRMGSPCQWWDAPHACGKASVRPKWGNGLRNGTRRP